MNKYEKAMQRKFHERKKNELFLRYIKTQQMINDCQLSRIDLHLDELFDDGDGRKDFSKPDR